MMRIQIVIFLNLIILLGHRLLTDRFPKKLQVQLFTSSEEDHRVGNVRGHLLDRRSRADRDYFRRLRLKKALDSRLKIFDAPLTRFPP